MAHDVIDARPPTPAERRVWPADEAPEHTRRLLVRIVGWIRLGELVPWPMARLSGMHLVMTHEDLFLAGYTLLLAWSAVFGCLTLIGARLNGQVMAADATVAAATLLIVGHACPTLLSTTWTDPAVGPALGTVLAGSVVWWRRGSLWLATALTACYIVGTWPALAQAGPGLVPLIGNSASFVGFTVVGGLISSQFMRHAEIIRRTTRDVLAAREQAAARMARQDERSRQYRMLHDTVLATLNAIALGVDHTSQELRHRCAAEADMIRGILSGVSHPASDLADGIAMVVHDQAALGMRIHSRLVGLPPELSPAVVSAFSGACREALNNVAKHAGTAEAWLTASGEPGGAVRITIVDRGAGFDPASAAPRDGGLAVSIAGRMAEVGGRSTVDSGPGEGTWVELLWPDL